MMGSGNELLAWQQFITMNGSKCCDWQGLRGIVTQCSTPQSVTAFITCTASFRIMERWSQS